MGITVNVGNMPIFQRIRTGESKSSKQKLERQQNRDSQLEMLEKQKAGLKNRECGSLEEIGAKLDLLHSYEDQIKTVKHAFNMEEIGHILDEAREKGEKIAEEIKKLLPETREEALLEDAISGEESEGMLSELLGELPEELPEEETEKALEELSEGLAENLSEELSETALGSVKEMEIAEAVLESAGEMEMTEAVSESAGEMETIKELADLAAKNLRSG